MKYRSRLDIIAMILKAMGEGAKKTTIMYEAYLSYKQMTEYLAFLTEKRMIYQEPETGLYKLTRVGSQALVFILEIEKLVGVPGRRIEDVKSVIVPLEPQIAPEVKA